MITLNGRQDAIRIGNKVYDNLNPNCIMIDKQEKGLDISAFPNAFNITQAKIGV